MSAVISLEVPVAVGPAIAGEVRHYGELGVETGGFLLAREGTSSA